MLRVPQLKDHGWEGGRKEERKKGKNPCFIRPFNEWEVDSMERFLACLCLFAWEVAWGKVVTLDQV